MLRDYVLERVMKPALEQAYIYRKNGTKKKRYMTTIFCLTISKIHGNMYLNLIDTN